MRSSIVNYKASWKNQTACILFFVVMLASNFSFSQALTATVSKNPVGAGEQFSVTFSINGNGSGFQAPSFKDFGFLGGPSTSTNMVFSNGNMSQTVTYTYYLQARNEGTY